MRTYAALGVLLAMGSGCSKGGGMPLDIGKTWTYQVLAEGEPSQSILTITVAREERIAEAECIVLEYKLDGELVLARWLKPTTKGLEEYRTKIRNAGAIEWKSPGYYLRKPYEMGGRYGDRVDLGPPFSGKMVYLATVESEEEVSTPAGKFKAWRIRYNADSGSAVKVREVIWFVPGKGIVKIEMTSQAGGAENVVEISAVLKKVSS